jgi:hypothetical protein
MEGEAETTPIPETPSPGEPKIVVKVDRKRSEAQKESLARAQAIRREKIAARKEAKASAKEVKAMTEEKTADMPVNAEPAKDYRLLYKMQKQSLAELMFEKRVNDKLIETLKEKRESAESARAPTPSAPTSAVPAVPARDPGWSVGMPPVKKNIMRHW